MGNRLSKIYTRTGDRGTTGLGDGNRVDKDNCRVEAYGTVDELNSALGFLLAQAEIPTLIREHLTRIQHELFDIGGELCIPGQVTIKPEYTQRLEENLDNLNENLQPLKEFVLPGGNIAAATCHLARTICRRAERCVVTLAKQQNINGESVIYLNRLSDLLFVMARVLARQNGGSEVLWRHER